MANSNELYLHEEILLLALRDEAGTVEIGSMHEFALGGAILAELLMRRRVRLDGRKGKYVEVVDSGSLGDSIVDECLQKIRHAKRRAAVNTWVSRFASIRNLTRRVAERLCERGILRADQGKVLLVFSRTIYPEANPLPERELIGRLREAIRSDAADIDPRTAVLTALANSAGLLAAAFDKVELRDRKKRIARIVEGEVVGKAAQEAVDAMQAAVMVTLFLPVVVGS